MRLHEIKVTPYRAGSIQDSNYLVSVPRIGYWQGNRLCAKYHVSTSGVCGQCTWYGHQDLACASRAAQFDYSRWDEVGDYYRWLSLLPLVEVSSIDSGDIDNAVAETRSQAVADSFSNYDALTDALQMPQTAREFMSASRAVGTIFGRFASGFSKGDFRIASRIPINKLLKSPNKEFRRIGGAWMKYRYAVMPLIYSYRDIKKVIHKGYIDHSKATRMVTSDFLGTSTPDSYIKKEVAGEVRVTSTVVCLYKSTLIAQMQAVAINPLTTLWEFIPYSWIADWFVNVGEYITANFSADLSSHALACTSIKTTKRETYTLVYKNNQTINSSNWGETTGPCWSGQNPEPPSVSNTGTTTGLLRVVDYNTYDRSTFVRGNAVSLRLNPSLNWKRIADTAVVSHQSLNRLFKRLF